MSHSTSASPTNLADQLPADVYHYLIHTLCLSLPPPLTDSPEDLARRNHFAIARIAALQPANATEADQAALYVAASEQWKEYLRIAHEPDTSPSGAMKCRAQANAMMRQAQGALRMLFRMQAARQKLEANTEARARAAHSEHRATTLMHQALSPQPAPAPTAKPATPAPKPQPQPAPAWQPHLAPQPAANRHPAVALGTTALTPLTPRAT